MLLDYTPLITVAFSRVKDSKRRTSHLSVLASVYPGPLRESNPRLRTPPKPASAVVSGHVTLLWTQLPGGDYSVYVQRFATKLWSISILLRISL